MRRPAFVVRCLFPTTLSGRFRSCARLRLLGALLALGVFDGVSSQVAADPIIEFLEMLGPGAVDPFLPPQVMQGSAIVNPNEPTLIELPDSLLLQYLSREEIEEFRNSKASIYSINVIGKKPV